MVWHDVSWELHRVAESFLKLNIHTTDTLQFKILFRVSFFLAVCSGNCHNIDPHDVAAPHAICTACWRGLVHAIEGGSAGSACM